jgi:hypothetical protein
VGSVGIDALGGVESVTAQLVSAVDSGQPALSAAQALADTIRIDVR